MEVKHRLRPSPDLSAICVVIVLVAIVLGRWLAPQPTPPSQAPELVLERAARDAAISASRALRDVAIAESDPLEHERRELYLANGRAELDGETEDQFRGRVARLQSLIARIRESHGDDAIAAIRARDVERLIPALRGDGEEDARSGELGSFHATLERWEAAVGEQRIADELVIRALFAARWNVIHSLPPTDGLVAIERRAYYGWLAIHGEVASEAMRDGAIDAYAETGARDADEIRAFVAWSANAWSDAAASYERAYESTGTLRFRNHAAGARAREAYTVE